jgi:SAM-dependent methyltransferase
MNTLVDPSKVELAARLHELYRDSSKHSVYQSVPTFVARALGYQEEIHSLWRSDAPRFAYLAERLNLAPGARLADIGANTGFFTLNFAHLRPDLQIAAFEMNPRHAEFIRLIASAFAPSCVEVRPQSCDLAGLSQLPDFDAVLLLNVVHHAGFDFDADVPDNNEAFTSYAIRYLAKLRTRSRQLVFQIGSNRGGDKSRPVFHRDDDVTRLNWLFELLKQAGWKISHLGYAQLSDSDAIVFRDVPAAVLDAAGDRRASSTLLEFFKSARLDRFPGEFHRRPLVIATAI